ncbi:hypothetical protein SUGI_0863030 [Cryptomeria japonica]|nr:hypothetical protein SUGI_0863030 [Cryptomeria japonica]
MMNFEQNENEEGNRHSEQGSVAAGHIGQAASALPGQKWYKCTYCNGGFSRAQALGGHMNVHRRERALRSRSSIASCDRGPHSSSPLSSLPLPFDQSVWSSLHPQLCTGLNREKYIGEKVCDRIHLKASSELSDEKTQIKFNGGEMGSSEDDEEVDLELRLGQNPHKKMRLGLPYFTIL